MEFKQIEEKIVLRMKQYGKKFNIKPDPDWYVLKLQEEVGEMIQAFLMLTKRARTKGKTDKELADSFAEELADVLGMTILVANDNKVDLQKAIEKKWFNNIE